MLKFHDIYDESFKGFFVVLYEGRTGAMDGDRLFKLVGGNGVPRTCKDAVEGLSKHQAGKFEHFVAVRGTCRWIHGRIVGIEMHDGTYVPMYQDTRYGGVQFKQPHDLDSLCDKLFN